MAVRILDVPLGRNSQFDIRMSEPFRAQVIIEAMIRSVMARSCHSRRSTVTQTPPKIYIPTWMEKNDNASALLVLTLKRHRIERPVNSAIVIVASEVAKDDVNSPLR